MTPLQERADKALRRMLPKGSTIYTNRIDFGGNSRQKNYYAVLTVVDGKIEDISGYVASALDRKHATDVWPSASGVQLQSAVQAHELLGQYLFDAYKVDELNENLKHVVM